MSRLEQAFEQTRDEDEQEKNGQRQDELCEQNGGRPPV
jgi:hypothetical protein